MLLNLLLVVAVIGALAYAIRRWRVQWLERTRAAEERMASFVAQVAPRAPLVQAAAEPPRDNSISQQRLLLDAAAKAGEAGEPALSIQLYARLLSRYPQTSFADQARAAVAAQKKKLAKPRAPDTSARDSGSPPDRMPP